MRKKFDPISLEIMWNRLISVVDEAAATLVRTSFSTIVKESNDYSCVFLDAKGNSLANNTASIPSFIATLSRTMSHFLKKFPQDQWEPGDVVMTNDPWLASGHLPDITMAMPIFHKGKLMAPRGPEVKGKRKAYFPEQGKFVACPVYDRCSLRPGAKFKGPAIVEKRESTTIVGVNSEASIDDRLNLIIERKNS